MEGIVLGKKPDIPPVIYERLPQLHLTPRALRELNRRPHMPISLMRSPDSDLPRFARQGGPDLQHIRGVCGYAKASRLLVHGWFTDNVQMSQTK